MPTTSAELALLGLDGMGKANVPFALLHGRERLLSGNVSDVDVVVAEPVVDVIRRSRAIWKMRGLLPIAVWPYDIGGTATAFLATEDAQEGIQLDLLFDQNGIGKYGVRSDQLLATATSSIPPEVSEEARLIYLWRKRSVKGQYKRLPSLTRQARTLNRSKLLAASEEITGSSRTGDRLLEGAASSRFQLHKHPVLRSARVLNRVKRPVGFWVHVQEPSIAEELAQLFGRFLVRSETGRVPPSASSLGWWAITVQPIRLRPGIYVSFGEAPRWPPPDLMVSTEDPKSAAIAITSAMTLRLPS